VGVDDDDDDDDDANEIPTGFNVPAPRGNAAEVGRRSARDSCKRMATVGDGDEMSDTGRERGPLRGGVPLEASYVEYILVYM